VKNARKSLKSSWFSAPAAAVVALGLCVEVAIGQDLGTSAVLMTGVQSSARSIYVRGAAAVPTQTSGPRRAGDAFQSPEARTRRRVSPAAQASGLFGTREIYSANTAKFTKWTGVWTRSETEQQAPAIRPGQKIGRCSPRDRWACNAERWRRFVADTQKGGKTGLDLLRAVNSFHNKSPYILDPVNWKLPDYWATLTEFLRRDGDCEDYALSKFVTLKALGFDASAMRIVVVQDENLRIGHAVLTAELHGTIYVLDNQVNGILPDSKILHYRPIYSINETGWWLHRRAS